MPCHLPVQKGVRNPEDCKCYGAVMRAFFALKNEPHHVALEVAQRVYRFHHPEDSKEDALLTVERWTSGEKLH